MTVSFFIIAGQVIFSDDFKFDYFRLPQGFGSLQCSGLEDNITSCPLCMEGGVFPGEEYEQYIPDGGGEEGGDESVSVIQISSSAPGAECCSINNNDITQDNEELAAIRCVGKDMIHVCCTLSI